MIRKIARHLYLLSLQGLPFGPKVGSEPTHIEKLRREARRNILIAYPKWTRPFLWVWMLIAWPVSCLIDVAPLGSFGIKNTRLRDRARLGWMGLRYSASPVELHEDNCDPRNSIFSSDLNGLYNFLKIDDANDWVDNKAAFQQFAEKSKLPIPQRHTFDSLVELNEKLKHLDFIVKKVIGNGGEFTLNSASDAEIKAVFDRQELFIIQSQIKSKPVHGFSTIFNRPLECRIVTAKKGDSCEAIVGMSWLHAADGSIEEVCFDPNDNRIQFEDNEAIPIDGMRELTGKLADLHREHGHCFVLGWDILFDGEKIWVLEANTNLSLMHIQMLTGQPIGLGPLAKYLPEVR